MAKKNLQINYMTVTDADALDADDKALLLRARDFTQHAYAPYSHFKVSAVGRTQQGNEVLGTNQENASYPVGICAERVMLATHSSTMPNDRLETIAISYEHFEGKDKRPVAPCGMCRQALLEYEERMGHPLRIIMSGQEGMVLVVESAKDLLPFHFSSKDL